jgi:uncharacterized protein YihD (DUF1040 family)
MRKKERIDSFLKKLEKLWKKTPDLRFTQIYTVIQIQAKEKFKIDDMYYLEEEQLEEIIEDIIKNGEV